MQATGTRFVTITKPRLHIASLGQRIVRKFPHGLVGNKPIRIALLHGLATLILALQPATLRSRSRSTRTPILVRRAEAAMRVLLGNIGQAPAKIQQGRRYPCAQLLPLVSLKEETAIDDPIRIVAVSKHVSTEGLTFFHREPIADRFMVIAADNLPADLQSRGAGTLAIELSRKGSTSSVIPLSCCIT